MARARNYGARGPRAERYGGARGLSTRPLCVRCAGLLKRARARKTVGLRMISKTCPGARAALLAAALVALPAHAAEEPLATVNGAPVTSGDVAVAEDELGPALAQIPEAQRRDRVLDYLIDLKLLAQQAAKEKLDQSDDFKNRMAYHRGKALMETLMKREVDKAVTDQAAKAFYDEQVGKAPRETEVHARHILVETEDEAKKIAQELKNG